MFPNSVVLSSFKTSARIKTLAASVWVKSKDLASKIVGKPALLFFPSNFLNQPE
jgi:hypothetical protein